MGIVHQVVIFHDHTVSDNGRPELKGVDNLFPVDLGFVRCFQFRSARQNMEVTVLINQQHVQALVHRIPEDLSLAKDIFEGFIAVEIAAVIAVHGENSIHPLRDGGCVQPALRNESGRIRRGGTDLGRILDHDIDSIVFPVDQVAVGPEASFHPDGGIFINQQVRGIFRRIRRSAGQVDRQGADLSACPGGNRQQQGCRQNEQKGLFPKTHTETPFTID